MKMSSTVIPEVTIGLDLGDTVHEACVLDAQGNVSARVKVGCSPEAVAKFFAQYPGARVAMETGTHCHWVCRLAQVAGLEALVGNARKLRMISSSKQKSDANDAQLLARIALIRARDQLVRARASLVNHVRGVVKGFGARINKCSTESFHTKAELPVQVRDALTPVLALIGMHTETIRNYDRRVEEQVAKNPDAQRLTQVPGVGPLIALAFLLTIEEAGRFEKSRTVGAYVGLAPRRDQSGAIDKQLHITKEGDDYLRRLLVTAAHRILGPFGPPCDLRAFGERIAARGGKNAKKRAVVAVARKLAVLLHALWKNKTDWTPTRAKKTDAPADATNTETPEPSPAAAGSGHPTDKNWKPTTRNLPKTGTLAA